MLDGGYEEPSCYESMVVGDVIYKPNLPSPPVPPDRLDITDILIECVRVTNIPDQDDGTIFFPDLQTR